MRKPILTIGCMTPEQAQSIKDNLKDRFDGYEILTYASSNTYPEIKLLGSEPIKTPQFVNAKKYGRI